jgi:hypothetical protein
MLLVLALAPACQDVDIFEPLPLASGDIAQFFAQAQRPAIRYQWDAAEGRELVLPSKGRVLIPAHALATSAGKPVVGVVEASVVEVRGKGELIRHNIGTTAGNSLLESAGILLLEIRQHGQLLRLLPGQSIRIQLPVAAYHPHLQVFNAEKTDGGSWEWREAAPGGEGALTAVHIYDAENEALLPGVEFAVAQLGWLQCARYADSNATGKAAFTSVKLPVGFSAENTTVFLVMQNMNTVVPFLDFDAALPKVSRSNLPTGHKAEIIAITAGEGENYFFARQPIIITEHLSIDLVPQKTALPEILAALDAL